MRGQWKLRDDGVSNAHVRNSRKSQHHPEKAHIQGMVRFPMNRIEGVRSACAAAWRRTLEANMLTLGFVEEESGVFGWGQERMLLAGTRAGSPHNDGCPDELGHDFQWRLGGYEGQVEGGELAMWCEG